jgi:hypothetical protein
MAFNKKKLECLTIEQYKKASKDSFDILVGDDPPDFVLVSENKKIGLEVTELYPDQTKSGSMKKDREIHLLNLHRELRKKLKEFYPKGFDFCISYKEKFTTKSNHMDQMDIFLKKIEGNLNSNVIEINSTDIERVFIKLISKFNSRISLMLPTTWNRLNKDMVQKCINFKQYDKAYYNLYETNWLLISTGLAICNDFNLNQFDQKEIEIKMWDKVILLDRATGDYVEIH